MGFRSVNTSNVLACTSRDGSAEATHLNPLVIDSHKRGYYVDDVNQRQSSRKRKHRQEERLRFPVVDQSHPYPDKSEDQENREEREIQQLSVAKSCAVSKDKKTAIAYRVTMSTGLNPSFNRLLDVILEHGSLRQFS